MSANQQQGNTPQPMPQRPMVIATTGTGEEFHADMSAIPINALDIIRLNLVQLTRNISILHHAVLQTTPNNNNLIKGSSSSSSTTSTVGMSNVPAVSWTNIQSQFNVILQHMSLLSEALAANKSLLTNAVVYPLPNFPLTLQAGSLRSLLRKKPTPEVEEWVKEGRTKTIESGLKISQDEAFADFAVTVVEEELRKHEWKGFLSREQVQAGERDPGLKLKTVSKPLVQQKPNIGAPGAPNLPLVQNGFDPISMVYEDGGWPIEKVIAYMNGQF